MDTFAVDQQQTYLISSDHVVVDNSYTTTLSLAMRCPADFSQPARPFNQRSCFWVLGKVLLHFSVLVIAQMT
ncbi:hypothetical protein PS691_03325 [Pseudomonas fluorescens]|uniref:Uncharacterized protein n=1 Tax=Pseudomonas fluorescens TaxID=294 RepID=A0A5E7D1K1_PSEFL|nr:hypothetical protein PS691_03325 [Pseudomonas fluorescens]